MTKWVMQVLVGWQPLGIDFGDKVFDLLLEIRKSLPIAKEELGRN